MEDPSQSFNAFCIDSRIQEQKKRQVVQHQKSDSKRKSFIENEDESR